jgi:hypothetical protein
MDMFGEPPANEDRDVSRRSSSGDVGVDKSHTHIKQHNLHVGAGPAAHIDLSNRDVGSDRRQITIDIDSDTFNIHADPEGLQVFPGDIHYEPIFPHSRRSMATSARVGKVAQVKSTIFSGRKLFVADNAVLSDAVFAEAGIHAECECTVSGHIMTRGEVRLQARDRVTGVIFNPSSNLVEAGPHSTLDTVIACGDVRLDAHSSVKLVHTSGDIHLGPGCRADYLFGRNIYLSMDVSAGRVIAYHRLTLEGGNVVHRCRCGHELSIGPNIRIQDADCIVARSIFWQGSSGLTLAGKPVDAHNQFIISDNTLFPHTGQEAPGAYRSMLITSRLTHTIWATIYELTGSTPSVDAI